MRRNRKNSLLGLPTTKPIIDTEVTCNHKWKDFGWYYESTYNYDSMRYDFVIYEPYVCIYCKKRKDVKLEEHTRIKLSASQAEELEAHWKEKYYDYLMPRAIVEDEINDFVMVDKDFLRIYDKTNAAIAENQLLLLEK